MVGCERSKASLRSHTHASPPSLAATMDTSRSRTGSARALSSGATRSAWSVDSGSRSRGEQHAAVSTGVRVSWDFDTRQY